LKKTQDATKVAGVLAVVFIVQRKATKSRKAIPSQQEKAWRSTNKYHSGCTNWYGLQSHSDEKTVAVVIHFDWRQRRELTVEYWSKIR
jgi:hypothetical protein